MRRTGWMTDLSRPPLGSSPIIGQRGEPLTVYGDGQQTRCFCDVDDVVQAIIALAECPEAVGQVFNVGSTEEVTTLELAHKVLALVDGNRGWRTADPGEILAAVGRQLTAVASSSCHMRRRMRQGLKTGAGVCRTSARSRLSSAGNRRCL